jgi:PAS domain S-box-containing protein
VDETALRIQALEAELARLREELNALRNPQAEDPSHLLRTLMEQTPDTVYFKDLQSRFLYASQAVINLFRLKGLEDLKGKTDFDFFSEEHARKAYEDEQEIIRTGEPKVGMEEVETWPGGWTTWVSTTKAPFRDAAGNIIGTFGTSRDITARKQTEIALKTSEEKLRMLFDHAVDGILMISLDGQIINANGAICDMTGWSQEELPGAHLSRLFSAESLVKSPLRFDLLNTGQRLVLELEVIHREGRLLPIEMHTKRMPDGTCQAILRDISERKRSEKALQTSESHFRELMERLQEGFALVDPEERFVFANPAASAIFGVPDDLVGRSLKDFVEPEIFQEVAKQTEQRKHAEPGHYELPIRRPDGEPRVLLLSVTPRLGEAGEYLGASGLFQDITERKRAEQALHESETNFLNLLNKLREGFAMVDPEERWTFTNPAMEHILGAEPGQLVGRSMREFVDEETYQTILTQTARRRMGESSMYEIRMLRLDGGLRDVTLSASPLLGASGEYLGAEGFYVDTTDRKRAEKALRESQERYLELFTNTTDAIFWIRVEPDGSFVVESINPAEEARLGITSGKLAGKTIQEILPGPLADPIVANYRRCVAEGHPIRYEEKADLSGGMKAYLTLLVPIHDANGRVARIVGFSQDITQAKQAEEALRQAQKLESLGVLAGGIAHDFNNLLTAILGNLNLAQMKSSPESPAQPYLENVERTVLKAAELTKQMLAYSGKGRFVVKPHDLNHVVLEMTHLLNVSISKKVLLRYDLARDLPAIEADAAQIQQVVMNLVTNASEAIGDQDGMISIATRKHFLDEAQLQSSFPGQNLKPGAHVVLEISDTGSGIPPEIMGRIFDPFFTTKHSGRGLGLSAMQGILRGHHAGIRITSEAGWGSTFSLFFPGASSSAQELEGKPSGKPGTRVHGRVLLVDDESEVRRSTAAMLEAIGLQVVTAVDGQDALDRFTKEQTTIDFVLLDLTMPRMDGREAFRELRRIRADLPVILYSGYSEHESLMETLEQGFAGFLQKPFSMDDLRNAIQQVTGQR